MGQEKSKRSNWSACQASSARETLRLVVMTNNSAQRPVTSLLLGRLSARNRSSNPCTHSSRLSVPADTGSRSTAAAKQRIKSSYRSGTQASQVTTANWSSTVPVAVVTRQVLWNWTDTFFSEMAGEYVAALASCRRKTGLPSDAFARKSWRCADGATAVNSIADPAKCRSLKARWPPARGTGCRWCATSPGCRGSRLGDDDGHQAVLVSNLLRVARLQWRHEDAIAFRRRAGGFGDSAAKRAAPARRALSERGAVARALDVRCQRQLCVGDDIANMAVVVDELILPSRHSSHIM